MSIFPRTVPERSMLGSKFLAAISVCARSTFYYFGESYMILRFARSWVVLLCLSAWLPGRVLAEDWPHWRGPNFNGISAEKGWSAQWPPEGPKILWKASVGIGFSSTSIGQGRVYTMGYGDEKETVFCFDAESGKTLWQHAYDSDLGDKFFEGGPTATPTVEGDSVYTLSRWGDVFCFEAASGKIRWSK